MEQFPLDFSQPPHSAERKPHVRGYLKAPMCERCVAAGRVTRDWSCGPCRTLYAQAWRAANPSRAEAALQRHHEREKAKRPERLEQKARTFVERYRTDPAFREKHKAKSAASRERNRDKRNAADRARRREKKLKAPPHASVVYFVRSYITGLVKIGTTVNLAARVVRLRNNHPGRLEILGVMDGGRDLERSLHHLFHGSRVDGEWFVETPSLVDFIRANASQQHPDLGGVSLAPGEGYRHRGRKKAQRR